MPSLCWEDRLRIAAEIAGALSYLHSAHSIPIIHRDVKSANILLDEHYTTKVADFGLSRLTPLDQTHINTLVQGTFGYLDPEYLRTSQLTERSDVYSYGMVLVELLTGEKPISFERPEAQRNLAEYFTVSLKQENLFELVEDGIRNEGNAEQLQVVADVANRCLNMKAEERPPMKEVAAELECLRGFKRHTLVQLQQSNEETMTAASEQVELSTIPSGASRHYSFEMEMIGSMNCPR
ncbi:Wall-associated receptor kinase, partial [Thalictrum thalictroides]